MLKYFNSRCGRYSKATFSEDGVSIKHYSNVQTNTTLSYSLSSTSMSATDAVEDKEEFDQSGFESLGLMDDIMVDDSRTNCDT